MTRLAELWTTMTTEAGGLHEFVEACFRLGAGKLFPHRHRVGNPVGASTENRVNFGETQGLFYADIKAGAV